jgi:hypothetical protein
MECDPVLVQSPEDRPVRPAVAGCVQTGRDHSALVGFNVLHDGGTSATNPDSYTGRLYADNNRQSRTNRTLYESSKDIVRSILVQRIDRNNQRIIIEGAP